MLLVHVATPFRGLGMTANVRQFPEITVQA
jgi:hypothetical protein